MGHNRASRHPKRIKRYRTISKRVQRKNGEQHEEFLHQTVQLLLSILLSHFSYYVLEAGCYRSGKHDPGRGRIDRADKQGADVTIVMETRPRGTSGRVERGSIIYDAKGSERATQEFNRKVVRYRSQKMARLKKAIWSHSIYRTRDSLLFEILADMVEAKLLPPSITIDKILKYLGPNS